MSAVLSLSQATAKMEGNVRKATGVIGKGTLALTGKFNGTLQFKIERCEFGYGNTGPLDEGFTFFS